MKPFETRTLGKWILAGEHTVLRGGKALVFPLSSQYLDWKFSPQSKGDLNVVVPKGSPDELKLLFWSVFEKACALKGLKSQDFSGELEMKAHIMVGSGLGASATLCVALTRWFQTLGVVEAPEAFAFAKGLEDLFHGESSGVDVAVVLEESGLIFQKGKAPQKIRGDFQPEWYLSHCGEKGSTRECVAKVKRLEEENPSRFYGLDEKMKQSVELCQKGLKSQKETVLLVEALNLAQECFRGWGLVTPALDSHMNQLLKKGALAVKPTGSGGGGFVLSLWDDAPKSSEISFLKASVI